MVWGPNGRGGQPQTTQNEEVVAKALGVKTKGKEEKSHPANTGSI